MARRVIVVGAGAAGILAAWRAANLGADVLLLEKNNRIGIKILISGGGKCNITHDGPIEDLLRAFRPNEARFLRPSVYRFTNRQVVEMLEAKGLKVYAREDGRIFPLEGTAKDVVAILSEYLKEAGVEVHLQTPVKGIFAKNGRMGVVAKDRPESADALILSVGGSSYPGSGTTGDAWPWLHELGHSIVPVKAALAPIVTSPEPPEGWAGVALRSCILKARQEGKEIARWTGDLLFTHHGVSGPTVLGISRIVTERKPFGRITLEADLRPADSFEAIREELMAYCRDYPKRSMGSWLQGFLPERLVESVLADTAIDLVVPAGQVTKKARNKLVEVVKGWQLGEARHVPIEKGEVVAGGVSLAEVDSHTMESKLVQGLYLCGELLDIAGPVGGYNLQAAFATGFVAGESAVKNAEE